MSRKIENCFLCYASTIPALLFNILSAKLNQNVIFTNYRSLCMKMGVNFQLLFLGSQWVLGQR